jgi:hypothetical protein
MSLKNTGAMCMVTVPDANNADGFKLVDLGNYFELDGKRVLVTSKENAMKYGKQIDVPIYIRGRTE